MKDILTVNDLSVRLGRRPVLHGVDLQLAAGELAALIGPNGSGKSTLLASVAGLHVPHSGGVVVAGHSLNANKYQARRHLGYMVVQEKLPGLLTARQCLTLFARSRGLGEVPESTWRQAGDFGLEPWLDEWLMSCSLGTRQKVSVLLALMGSPAVVLLDEPLNGLDPVSALALKRWLRQLTRDCGCTVLMATHDLAVVEKLHDHVLVLLDGRIVLDWDRSRMALELGRGEQGLEERIAEALGAGG